MIRKITALAAAIAFALTSFTPVTADARDRRHDGYYGRHYDGYNHNRHRRWRDRDDHGDAVAAGVIGLVLGLAIGAAASQPREPRARCYDNYRRCEPPQDYYRDGYYEQDPRYYEDSRRAYERDYGAAPDARYEECVRTERQWDRYANRYVTVDVPC
jgi:hypothetical protein